LLRQRTDRPHIATGRESQVSAQHAVAVALVRGRAGLDEFSDAAVCEPLLKALGATVRFKDDASFEVDGVGVRITLREGPPITSRIAVARGGKSRPLSDADLENKLRELCRHGGATANPEALIESIWSLDQAKDASASMRLAG
jgi:2-methylcitrate dehydratase PrpD